MRYRPENGHADAVKGKAKISEDVEQSITRSHVLLLLLTSPQPRHVRELDQNVFTVLLVLGACVVIVVVVWFGGLAGRVGFVQLGGGVAPG